MKEVFLISAAARSVESTEVQVFVYEAPVSSYSYIESGRSSLFSC